MRRVFASYYIYECRQDSILRVSKTSGNTGCLLEFETAAGNLLEYYIVPTSKFWVGLIDWWSMVLYSYGPVIGKLYSYIAQLIIFPLMPTTFTMVNRITVISGIATLASSACKIYWNFVTVSPWNLLQICMVGLCSRYKYLCKWSELQSVA